MNDKFVVYVDNGQYHVLEWSEGGFYRKFMTLETKYEAEILAGAMNRVYRNMRGEV